MRPPRHSGNESREPPLKICGHAFVGDVRPWRIGVRHRLAQETDSGLKSTGLFCPARHIGHPLAPDALEKRGRHGFIRRAVWAIVLLNDHLAESASAHHPHGLALPVPEAGHAFLYLIREYVLDRLARHCRRKAYPRIASLIVKIAAYEIFLARKRICPIQERPASAAQLERAVPPIPAYAVRERMAKGFARVNLKPGETKAVSISMKKDALAYHLGSTRLLENGLYDWWLASDSLSGVKHELRVD